MDLARVWISRPRICYFILIRHWLIDWWRQHTVYIAWIMQFIFVSNAATAWTHHSARALAVISHTTGIIYLFYLLIYLHTETLEIRTWWQAKKHELRTISLYIDELLSTTGTVGTRMRWSTNQLRICMGRRDGSVGERGTWPPNQKKLDKNCLAHTRTCLWLLPIHTSLWTFNVSVFFQFFLISVIGPVRAAD